jgi:hypothetical protein
MAYGAFTMHVSMSPYEHPYAPPRKRIQTHFDVATDDQARELSAAWEEIVSGKRTRISTAAEDLHEIMERARTALEIIVKALR